MKRSDHDKRGVALVLVLGMLSLLLILAVAFSVTMRIERTSAGNVSYLVFTRHFIWGALSQAMEDIDADMHAGGVERMCPNWNVMISAGGAETNARIVWGEALQHIPTRYRGATNPASFRDMPEENGVMGRFAYVVYNCSDLLDANYVGGSVRAGGTNVREIQIGVLPDMKDSTNFALNRQSDLRYESVKELSSLHTNVWNTGPDSFVAASYYPPGYLVGSNVFNDQVYIGGDVSDLLSRKSEIKAKLIASGIGANLAMLPAEQARQADCVFSNLIDYVDVDSIPQDLASPCTESVPMINEVVVTGRVMMAGSVATGRIDVTVEWWYPFVRPSPLNFSISAQITGTMSNTVSTNSVNFSGGGTMASGYSPGVDTKRFGKVTFQVRPPGVQANAGDALAITTRLRAQVTVGGGSPTLANMADAVPYPTNTWFDIVCNPVVVAGAGQTAFTKGMDCGDPRFNWDATNKVFWMDSSHPSLSGTSLDTTNGLAKFWMARAVARPDEGWDTDLDMYVSDRGSLLAVGELGNLVRGTPGPMENARTYLYKTVRLYSTTNNPAFAAVCGYDRVLDYFATSTNRTSMKGLGNLNTTNASILTALFSGVSLYYPEHTNSMSATEASALAGNFVAYRQVNSNLQFTNKSDVGAMEWRKIVPGRSDVERESAIAYTAGLVGTRQNIFTIVLAAGAASKGMGIAAKSANISQWLGYQRAIVVVWRDPYPDENNNHRWFVRYFRYLGDS